MDGLMRITPFSTPWKRIATYEAPADLPACPSAGCTCAWLWVPNGCGQANMYVNQREVREPDELLSSFHQVYAAIQMQRHWGCFR